MILFRVLLTKASSPNDALTVETRVELDAKIMSHEEAGRAGYQGIPPAPDGAMTAIVIVSPEHERRMHYALETNQRVIGFDAHHIG